MMLKLQHSPTDWKWPLSTNLVNFAQLEVRFASGMHRIQIYISKGAETKFLLPQVFFFLSKCPKFQAEVGACHVASPFIVYAFKECVYRNSVLITIQCLSPNSLTWGFCTIGKRNKTRKRNQIFVWTFFYRPENPVIWVKWSASIAIWFGKDGNLTLVVSEIIIFLLLLNAFLLKK